MNPAQVQARWGVVMAKTVRELQGVSCIELSDHEEARKQIACTRSFGKPVRELGQLENAISEFASRAAQRLRNQESLAGQILVFAGSSPLRRNEPQYSRSLTLAMPSPTDDTRLLVDTACLLMKKIYRPGISFARAGVMLMELQSVSVWQHRLDLDDPQADSLDGGRGASRLMRALDGVNTRWGRDTLQVGSALKSAAPNWQTKRERLTPRYTTCWEEMAIART